MGEESHIQTADEMLAVCPACPRPWGAGTNRVGEGYTGTAGCWPKEGWCMTSADPIWTLVQRDFEAGVSTHKLSRM